MSKQLPNRAEIVAAMDGTLTAQEIADRFGAVKSTVYSIYMAECDRGAKVRLKHALKGGRKSNKPLAVNTLRHGGPFIAGGGIIQLVASLDRPIQDWLIAQVPKDGTMSDLLRGLIVDAFTEENPSDAA